jgi:hypothetical protein
MAVTWKRLAYQDETVLKTAYTPQYTVMAANTDLAPAAITMAASTVLARLAAGGIVAATVAEMQTLLSITPGGVTAHNVFSTVHSDVVGAADPVAGDVMIGNDTPKWAKLAISVPGAGLINHFAVANGETLPSWKAMFDATAPTTNAPSDSAAAGTASVAARRDHQHQNPATWAPASHALSGHSVATADLSLGGYQIDDQVIQTVANVAAVNAYATPVVGKILWSTAELAAYICTVSA